MTAAPEPAREQELRFELQMESQQHSSAKNLHALLDLPAAMELRQIELIYRAEGNANLVLALPQFKKVLRLPKMISNRRRQERKGDCQPTGQCESSVGVVTKKAGDLTMPDSMAYIGIMRRLLGNEFVCGADIVAIPKEDDRFWINEQIRAHRPVSRLDKEFVGPFGLLLPDVTQLPATFDVLLANLQAKGRTGDEEDGRNRSWSGVRRLGDTYAIEIKPKQGWIQLASDVNDLFDLMPAIAETKPNKDTTDKEAAEQRVLEEDKEPKDQEHQALTRDKCWCRYCNMQLLKLHNGKIKRLGHYCPLELFSGYPSRMLSALDALLACPQNNLRVFRDGNLIYGDHANSISFDELHSRVFPGEMMVLIKHLLVACLLREYDSGQELQPTPSSPIHVSIGQMETMARAANVDRKAEKWEAGCFVDAGQSSSRTRAAAATTTTETQRYTKLARIDTTTDAAAEAAAGAATRTSKLSGNVLAMATRTETKTETETLPTPGPSTSWNLNPNRNQQQNENEVQTRNRNENEATNQLQAQINKAEIFRLPKNCVLQKILNLQLLVKNHFDFMWQSGYAQHSQRTYNSLRGLLSAAVAAEETELDLKPDPEQAYLLGATALDCSIMLTFQEIEIEWETDCPAGGSQSSAALQPWCVSLLGHHFLTKLSVLDLDPKPDSHFHKFIEQTREMEKCRRALN
ncbi:hypothetical protein KR026_009536 [Drosophila bipectinata]|nr:hypothetical protein KR026_009536 [Drosophila bipectinata]